MRDQRGLAISLLHSPLARVLVFAGVCALVFLAVHSVALSQPFHWDSAAYLSAGYPTRPMACHAFRPLAAVLGEATLPTTTALAYALTVVLAISLFSRLLGRTAALFGVVGALATPASILTATHGKEDFLALAWLLGACHLARSRRWLPLALAGPLLGAAWMTKEIALVATPFVVLLVVLRRAEDESTLESGPAAVGRVIALLLGAALTILIVDAGFPRHLLGLTDVSATGQFLLPSLDRIAARTESARYGLTEAFFFAQFVALLVPFLDVGAARRRFALLSIGQGVLLLLFLASISTHHFRLHLWPAVFLLPAAAVALERTAEFLRSRSPWIAVSWRVAAFFGVAAAVAFSLAVVLPAVQLRHSYNPVARFYGALSERTDAPLLLGMDDCMLAAYFSGLECRTHPYDPTAAEADAFADDVLRELESGRTVLLIPDFFAYDGSATMRRAMEQRFSPHPEEPRWYENYHRMDYGVSLGEARLLASGGRPGCEVEVREGDVIAELDPSVRAVQLLVDCPGETPHTVRLPMTRGRAFPGLAPREMQRIVVLSRTP